MTAEGEKEPNLYYQAIGIVRSLESLLEYVRDSEKAGELRGKSLHMRTKILLQGDRHDLSNETVKDPEQ